MTISFHLYGHIFIHSLLKLTTNWSLGAFSECTCRSTARTISKYYLSHIVINKSKPPLVNVSDLNEATFSQKIEVCIEKPHCAPKQKLF